MVRRPKTNAAFLQVQAVYIIARSKEERVYWFSFAQCRHLFERNLLTKGRRFEYSRLPTNE